MSNRIRTRKEQEIDLALREGGHEPLESIVETMRAKDGEYTDIVRWLYRAIGVWVTPKALRRWFPDEDS